ncbi:hypothetical protein Ae201684P_014262 [Aphanomyces euteiches]|nr:hypothetical protein Ae201684P_014262 [Aphanomyces euteiches]
MGRHLALGFLLAWTTSPCVWCKVSIGVLRALEVSPTTDIAVEYYQPNIQALPAVRSKSADYRTTVYEALAAESRRAEAQLTTTLKAKCTHYWIKKSAVCKSVSADEIQGLAALSSVARIAHPFNIRLSSVIVKANDDFSGEKYNVSETTPQWGVETIGAPTVWAAYTRGRGIVVGSIDTGANYQHEAIRENWRRYKGWLNPFNKTETPLPFDSNGHGTHTIGTMVGKYGIGVAPDAEWISCIGMYDGHGDMDALLTCAQFMMCPTDIDGSRPECKLGADVVNNSWGSDSALGYSSWFEDIVSVWRSVGIVPVFANGNSGPLCATSDFPAAYNRVISVGAIGSSNNSRTKLAAFSSKGPASIAFNQSTNSTRPFVKPDISAPGFYTVSANANTTSGYYQLAGTSMAAPHVAGVIALIKSYVRGLTNDEIYSLLTETADRRMLEPEPKNWYFKNGTVMSPGAKNCGGFDDSKWPNNRFGYGRVNVAAVFWKLTKKTPSPTRPAKTTTTKPIPTTVKPFRTTVSPLPTTFEPIPNSTVNPLPTTEVPWPTTTATFTTDAPWPSKTATFTTDAPWPSKTATFTTDAPWPSTTATFTTDAPWPTTEATTPSTEPFPTTPDVTEPTTDPPTTSEASEPLPTTQVSLPATSKPLHTTPKPDVPLKPRATTQGPFPRLILQFRTCRRHQCQAQARALVLPVANRWRTLDYLEIFWPSLVASPKIAVNSVSTPMDAKLTPPHLANVSSKIRSKGSSREKEPHLAGFRDPCRCINML